MIKVDPNSRIINPTDIGTRIPWDNLQSALTRCGHELGLPIEVQQDEMREGGIFSEKSPCIVIYNTQHRRSYYHYVIKQEMRFNTCYMTIFMAGNSKNVRNRNWAGLVKDDRSIENQVYRLSKGEVGSILPSFTQMVFLGMGKKADRKIVEEQMYYERVDKAIQEALPLARSMSEKPVTPPKPPVTPTKPPVTPTKPPVTPTKPPVTPTKPPVTPTKPPVTPTKPPVTPTKPPVTPPKPPVTPPKPRSTTSKVIGIDLGTTNSCVAVLEGNVPTIIPNSEGARVTPSVVAFDKNGKRIVGQAAKNQAAANPKRTVFSIKRQMGSAYRLPVDGSWFTPQQLSAMVLSKLKEAAEDYLGATVTNAVITVPAYFTNEQRQATKDAGEIAGLKVLRIINEPTSAALAYGVYKDINQKVMVYDLGGGTFDVSLLEMGDGVVEVLATSGDNRLGGDDFDQCLVDYMIAAFYRSNGIDLFGNAVAMRRMKDAAEKAKIELSSLRSTTINLPYICDDASGPKHLSVTVTRDQFNDMISDMLQRTQSITRQVLADAGLTARDVHKVLLVGGSTRVPAVQDAVRAVMGDKIVKQINPDECVAMGAAVQGSVLIGETTKTVLLDVIPITLGVETKGGAFVHMIKKNTTIPNRNSRMFTTSEDNQTSIEVRVYQGEDNDVAYNKFLGCFRLGNIPAAKQGTPQIEVTFDIDANGILHVSAKDKITQRENSITILGSANMSQQDKESAIRDARDYESRHRP